MYASGPYRMPTSNDEMDGARGLVATLKILHGAGAPPPPHAAAPPVATVRAGGAAHREVVSLADLRAIMRQLGRARAERYLARKRHS